jgi:DNA-binding GntR family transcriptional regulator
VTPTAADLLALGALRGIRIEHSTAAERAADALRGVIIRGDLPPGSQLREAPLVTALGVSRNTLREAFRLLGRDGLVVHEVHRGVEVKRLTEDDITDIYATRLPLELAAIERSAEVEPERLLPLRETVDRAAAVRAERDWKQLATFDLVFHQHLVALLDSERVDTFFKGVLAELRLALALADDQGAFLTPFVDWNDRMCGLLEAGDRDGCAAEMRAYLAEAERMLRGFTAPLTDR